MTDDSFRNADPVDALVDAIGEGWDERDYMRTLREQATDVIKALRKRGWVLCPAATPTEARDRRIHD